MKAKLTKGDVYVVVDTPKKAKKLKKLLDMFGERTYSNFSIQDCLDNNKNVIGFEKEDNAFMSSYVDQFDNFRKKVSVKKLRNILAKEHLISGDYIVATIGKIKYLVEFERVGKIGFIIGKKYLPFSEFGRNVEPYGWGGFDYFDRYATPEEIDLLEPKQKDLKVGKWYKYIYKCNNRHYGYLLFNFNGSFGEDSQIGFTHTSEGQVFVSDISIYKEHVSEYTEATPQEIESALIEEAKRRGFDYDDFVFEDLTNILWANYDSDIAGKEEKALFNNGKWGTIIKQDKFAELKESHKNKEVVEFRHEKTNNEWLDFFQNTHSWLNDPEYPINPSSPVKVGDWMFNPNSKKITQVKKDNHGKSLIGSGWIKIKDTELVEKLNSL